jgi:hypothetical protein
LNQGWGKVPLLLGRASLYSNKQNRPTSNRFAHRPPASGPVLPQIWKGLQKGLRNRFLLMAGSRGGNGDPERNAQEHRLPSWIRGWYTVCSTFERKGSQEPRPGERGSRTGLQEGKARCSALLRPGPLISDPDTAKKVQAGRQGPRRRGNGQQQVPERLSGGGFSR